MAKATKKEVPTIFLELNMDEAAVIRALIQATTGSSPQRRLAEGIDQVLYDADVQYPMLTTVGTVRFKEALDDDDDLPF